MCKDSIEPVLLVDYVYEGSFKSVVQLLVYSCIRLGTDAAESAPMMLNYCKVNLECCLRKMDTLAKEL